MRKSISQALSIKEKSGSHKDDDSHLVEFVEVERSDKASFDEKECANYLASFPVLMLVKGSETAPKCGFTRKLFPVILAALRELREKDSGAAIKFPVKVATLNILEDEVLRKEVKRVTNWPTFPQVLCKGKDEDKGVSISLSPACRK